MIEKIKLISMASLLAVPLLSANTHPFTHNDDHKRSIQDVEDIRKEANFVLSKTSFTWRLKRNFHNALFIQAVTGNVSNAKTPLPEMIKEDHEIVPFQKLGFSLNGVYTLKTPPKTEASLIEQLGSKLLTFSLNHLSLDEDNLPSIPKNYDTLMHIILPDEYASIFPRPRIPGEIFNNVNDILAGCALSGPFANRIKKASQSDLIKTRFESNNPHSFYVIDLNEYSDFSVSSQYEKLGGKALLLYSEDRQKLETVSIIYEGQEYTPYDNFWPQLQKIMMATQTTDTAMIRHLLETHIIMAGLFSSVVHKAFPIDHSLRAFLYPHIHGTIATNNYKLSILISGEGAMFPSLFSFKEKGILEILQKNINDFDIFKLDVKADLENRGMLPNEDNLVNYPYGNITLKLWELTRNYVEDVVHALYPTESDVSNDESVLKFYNLLAEYTPNNQLKEYASVLNKENLIRLLALYIYNDSIEHYIVGTMTYHFQLNANAIPFSVRRDGTAPSIGEAQNAANLIFATQPTATPTLLVDSASDRLLDTGIKLAIKNYQQTLLQMQTHVESSFRDPSTTIFNFKAIQMGVNS